MNKNFFLLKLGGILNLYFFSQTLIEPLQNLNNNFLIPAQIFFIVSSFRCFYPVNYTTNVALHDSYLSSIFFTRLFATFSEIAYIYQFSYLIRYLNIINLSIIDLLSWLMIIQVIFSQFFVWGAIITKIQKFYFYEEIGWAIIFILNTLANLVLFIMINSTNEYILLIKINLLFGFIYLPWQFFHLKSIKSRLDKQQNNQNIISLNWYIIKTGLKESFQTKIISNKINKWGGTIGLTWMLSYWATIIPIWIYFIISNI